jgi:8-oxo-dGTP pyrophosphatase MutT (NUDIX family)
LTNKFKFVIEVDQKFSLDQLSIIYVEPDLKYPKEAIDLIERIWIQETNNGNRFDGKLVRLISYERNRDSLYLKVTSTSYKFWYGTTKSEFRARFGTDLVPNHLSVGAVLLTRDDKIFVGKRSPHVDVNPGKFSMIAGLVDPKKDMLNETPSLAHALTRELNEEKGLRGGDIESLIALGLVHNMEHLQTYVPFEMKTNLDSSKVSLRKPTEKEFSSFIWINAEANELEDFLASNFNNISQTAIANLLLFGQNHFGTQWFKGCKDRLNAS